MIWRIEHFARGTLFDTAKFVAKKPKSIALMMGGFRQTRVLRFGKVWKSAKRKKIDFFSFVGDSWGSGSVWRRL